MASIELRAKELGEAFGSTYFHIYIIYTDDLGNQTLFRGGPTNRSEEPLYDVSDPFDANIIGDAGDLIATIEPYKKIGSHIPLDWDEENDDPRTVLLTGSDASLAPMVNAFTNRANEIHNLHLGYDPFFQNSNGFIFELLKSINIKYTPPHWF